METQRGRAHRRYIAHEREHIYPSLGHRDRRMSPAQGTGQGKGLVAVSDH